MTSKGGRGGRRYLPIAFTEHGAVMLANVLRSANAIEASLFIVRAFVALRRAAVGRHDLVKLLRAQERRVVGHDAQIRDILRAIRNFAANPTAPIRKIGFRPEP